MSAHQSAVGNVNVGVSLVTSPNGLAAIRGPACSAAIWVRKPLSRLQTWIDGLDPGQLPRGRITVRAEGVRDAMTQLSAAAGLPDCDERTMLIDDVAALASIFARVTETRHVRVRLAVVDTNACRKFHIDAVTARLICTYRGDGTQYGNGTIGEEPTNIHQVPTGSPMIMRGTAWPSGAKPGLLHRSPPIEGTRQKRFVLVLDAIAETEIDDAHGHIH